MTCEVYKNDVQLVGIWFAVNGSVLLIRRDNKKLMIWVFGTYVRKTYYLNA